MSLDTQLIDIPFTGGLSTKLDQVLTDKSRLLSLSNGTFNKNGTLQRRDAWTQVTGTNSTNPVELCTLGSELLFADGTTNQLCSVPENPGLQAVNKGLLPPFQLTSDSVARSYNLKGSLDHASTNGYSIYIWQDFNLTTNNGIKYTVVEEASGNRIVAEAVLDASANARFPMVIVGGPGNAYFIITYQSSSTQLKMASVVAATGQIQQASTNLTTASQQTAYGITAIWYDMQPTSTGTAMLVYTNVISTNVFVYGITFDYTGSVTHGPLQVFNHGIVVGATAPIALGKLAGSAGSVLVVGATGSNHVYTTTVSETLTAVTQVAVSTDDPAKQIVACLNQSNSKVRVYVMTALTISWFEVDSSNAHGSTTNLIATNGMAFNIANRPVYIQSDVLIPVILTASIQSGVYVLDNAGNVLAVTRYGQTTLDPNIYLRSASTYVLSDGSASIPVLTQGRVSTTFTGTGSAISSTQAGITRTRLIAGRNSTGFVSTPSYHAQANNCLYFSGSYMAMYDGQSTSEAGFFHFPEGVTAVPYTVGDPGSITGTFLVCALYEWVDGQGQRHQSAPSVDVSVTLSSNHGITMTAPPLELGARSSACSVVFYRSANNGTTLYRINAPTAPLGNGKFGGAISYTDTTATTDPTVDPITGNEILYTTGGALPNDNPPACNAIGTYQGRIVYSNAEDGQDWRFSQTPVFQQGLYFNEELLGGRTDQNAGVISALAPLDDKLIIATQTQKFVVSGSGPASTGTNGSYSTPLRLPSDVGVLDQRTIAIIPDTQQSDGAMQTGSVGGMAHQTQHGIYLLTRGLTDIFIGFGIDSYVTGQTLTSVTVMTDKSQVRWTVPAQTSAPVIVYDYAFNQWSTFVSSLTFYPNSSAIWQGIWVAGIASTYLIKDVVGSYQDQSSTAIIMSLRTAWVKLSSLQGFQRVRRANFVGNYSAPSTLAVTPYYDYGTATTTGASESTSSITQSGGARWQFRYHLPRQRCEAIQFVITDTPTSGSYAGVGLSAMTLECGIKKGPYRLPTAQST